MNRKMEVWLLLSFVMRSDFNTLGDRHISVAWCARELRMFCRSVCDLLMVAVSSAWLELDRSVDSCGEAEVALTFSCLKDCCMSEQIRVAE